MPAYFWFVTTVMTVVAAVFLIEPLMNSGRRKLILTIGFAVPIITVSLYSLLGSPSIASGRSTATGMGLAAGSATSTGAPEKVASVLSMVDGLALRLETSPDDAEGWLLLARSYQHLGRLEEASVAYARAAALGQHDTELERQLTPAVTGARLVGTVRLSEQAAAIVHPTDTLFIFARAESSTGAPAAVLRLPATGFPLNFVLDDMNSMGAGAKLSEVDSVTVTARVSRAGVATQALQGLEASIGPVKVAEQEHLVLIIE